jgi:hypothetical protein
MEVVMQRELSPNEVDWVFCWRTSTGEVRPGARDRGAVQYQPDTVRSERGLRTIVRGRAGKVRPTGPRLDEQSARSRGELFVWGYVTHGALVPARTERELHQLENAARAAIVAGRASEWSLAGVGARGRVRWAVRLGQQGQDEVSPPLVAEMAERVGAPWTLRVEENGLVCVDRWGRTIDNLEADTFFDDAPLPVFAAQPAAERTEVAPRKPMLIRLEPDDGADEQDDAASELGRAMIAWLRGNGVEVLEDDGPALQAR